MAKRKQLFHPEEVKNRFYVYAFRDGAEVVYIGKGTGRRLQQQEKRFGLKGEVLGRYECEDKCFAAERDFIKQLMPNENRNRGGGGGRVTPASLVPLNYRGKITEREFKKAMAQHKQELAEIERLGSRRYSARILISRLNDANCEQWGVSKVDLNRLREVAYGPRC